MRRAITIADLRAAALKRLPNFVGEFLEGGAEEEATLRRNREAFDARRFRPRVLRDGSNVDLSTTILGARAALPLAIAPTGLNSMFRVGADMALARAATAAGIPFGQSAVANAKLSDIAAIPGVRQWFQVYLFGPDAVWETLVERARQSNCEALIVTVDTNLVGNREWDRRSYARPLEVSFKSRLDVLRHPAWALDTLRHGMPRIENLEEFVPEKDRSFFAVARWLFQHQRPDLDWTKLAEIRKAWPGKLLLKGVQHPEDVRLALKAGAEGVILSNHGGRQLDRSAAPLDLIAEARRIAGRDFSIFVDSGFRRGTEIVQALALGADAVMLGRATLYGVAAGGEAGVARALAILKDEIQRTMVLLGARSIAELGPEIFEDAAR